MATKHSIDARTAHSFRSVQWWQTLRDESSRKRCCLGFSL